MGELIGGVCNSKCLSYGGVENIKMQETHQIFFENINLLNQTWKEQMEKYVFFEIVF
jgi:hypothetical protein